MNEVPPEAKNAEKMVEEIIKAYGWGVIPRRKFNRDEGESVAPMLESENSKEVLPDIEAKKAGRSELVEVKLKTEPTYYRKQQEEQHGIDADNWEDYSTIQAEFGDRVWLFIVEKNTGLILRQCLDDLVVDHRHHNGGADGEAMVYFPRRLFSKVPVNSKMFNDDIFVWQDSILTLTTEELTEQFTLFPNGPEEDDNQTGLSGWGD